MSAPQATPTPTPTTALLARKGLAAPVGALSDAALAQVSGSETLPEVGEPAQAGAAPAASLLAFDFMAGRPPERSSACDLARTPPAPAPAPAPASAPAPAPALHLAFRPALAAGLALALVLAAVYGYRSGWFESESPEQPQALAAAAVTPTVTPAQTQAESPPATPPVTESDPSSGAGQPSVDVVRIEPDGAAVIAGRAAPGAELIVLDNGAPIGVVTADAYGEWVFIATSPLPSGAHDFGLVIKDIRGGVSVPAAGQAPAKQDATAPGVPKINEPSTVAGAAAAVPIPPRKPDIETARAAGMPSPAFVVQLASVKSRAGAQQEWRALRKRFPEILSQMSLSLDEAKLAGGAAVVRLRIGAFPKQAEADALCARLAAKHQDCLVVRTSVKR